MSKLEEYVKFVSGTPQFRIIETTSGQAPTYRVYSQNDLFEDLAGVKPNFAENKVIRTKDQVYTLLSGDIVFSLISGTACIVGKEHEGYLYTQNYIKMLPDNSMDGKFLLYLLNENDMVRKQFQVGLQGSITLKYNLKQLRELMLPVLPSLEKQKMIGDVYLKQLKLEALKCKVARAETTFLLHRLGEVMRYDGKPV